MLPVSAVMEESDLAGLWEDDILRNFDGPVKKTTHISFSTVHNDRQDADN